MLEDYRDIEKVVVPEAGEREITDRLPSHLYAKCPQHAVDFDLARTNGTGRIVASGHVPGCSLQILLKLPHQPLALERRVRGRRRS